MKIGKFKKIAAIGLALTMAIGLLYTSGTVNAVEENPTEDNGLELNKTAVYNSDGTYDITLEAYTTGIMESTESTVPSDIVLVLDQSGSMAEQITVTSEAYYSKVAGENETTIWDLYGFEINSTLEGYDSQKTYFTKIGDKYYPLVIECEFKEFSITGTTYGIVSLYYIDDSGEKQLVCTEKHTYYTIFVEGYFGRDTGYQPDPEPTKIPLEVYQYNENTYRTTKLNALKDTAKNFINQIKIENEKSDTDIDHRIAVVGFANGYKWGNQYYYYSDTELFIGSDSYTYGNDAQRKYGQAFVDPDTALNSIKELSADGGTLIQHGIEMANGIFEANQNNDGRKRVVVVLTDGEPGWSGFDSSMADQAIAEAYKSKNTFGATVYTVGMFNGANADNYTSNSNRFMHYVSNNYPNAQGMYNAGSRIKEPKYYMSASNANGLSEIFESIFDDISKPTIELGSETIIKDTMSNYFEVVGDDIKVEKVPCTGKNGEDYTFGTANPIESGITKQVINNGKGVTVTGYNFDDNFVSIDDKRNPHGNMLRITFTVKPIDGFIGGLSVPTNGADSGLYQNSSANTPLESFEMPYVDVDLNYDYDVTDQGMYIGNDWKDVQKFLNLDSQGLPQYKIGNQTYSLNDNYVNDYVDVVYTIKHGNDTVGTYTVNAGEKQGTLDLKNSFDATSFTETEGFTVTVNVTNKAGQNPSTTDNYEQVDKVVKDAKNANLYVFVPTLNTDDTEIFLGESTDLDDRISVEDNWNCTDSSLTVDKLNTIKNTLTDKPTLTYTYSPNDNVDANGIYKPATKGEHVFEVNVYNGKKDITNFSKFKHDHSDNPNCIENHFFVVVKDGSITINKSINNDHLIDESKGTPIFTYKIEKELDNGEYKLVGYKYISMEQSGEDWIQKTPINLSGLEKGTYKITELSNLRYEKVKVQVDGFDYNNPILRVTIDSDSPSHTIDYTNKVKSTSYDSDSSVLINKFVLDEDGSVTIQQDRLDQ